MDERVGGRRDAEFFLRRLSAREDAALDRIDPNIRAVYNLEVHRAETNNRLKSIGGSLDTPLNSGDKMGPGSKI